MIKMNQNESLVNHVKATFSLGFKSLFYSKKWFIYIFLSLAPFFFSLLSPNKLLGSSNALTAFILVTITYQFGFFYEFGVLLLALPITSDEITDHIIDLNLIRPVPKSVLFITRYIIIVLANTIINSTLILFYYIYFYTVNNRNIYDERSILVGMIIFFFIANLIYSALYLGIGLLGSKGFGIGVFIAVFEIFFLGYLFLEYDASMPRTNLQVIADYLLGNAYTYTVPSGTIVPGLNQAILYILVLTIVFLIAGYLYFRRRDFD